ncbi:hypothetical protein SteCoe_33403 [Stentor coeruleus]|uniref:Uncharacterized protein n=1 Tax=Stentor coeruleus TaxID=5963 RepID=A0A1R2AX22_9CILI|nr:hypothetical protein SteCoe_33403 [Stentor coeruleus]
MKNKIPHNEEFQSQPNDKKKHPFIKPSSQHANLGPSIVKPSSTLSSKNPGISPRSKPIRAILRSDLYSKHPITIEDHGKTYTKNSRPPCRQSENIFDLDETSKIVRKPIRIVRKQPRPPSRHKTPPKALGLELPPGVKDYHSMDSTPVNKGFSMSQPLHFSLLDERYGKKKDKARADSVKVKNPKQNCDKNISSRAWSAKHNGKNTNFVFSQRKSDAGQGPSSTNDTINSPYEISKRSSSKGKNLTIFSNLQSEFLDLFA